jgi:hypothetical protein
VEGPLALVNGNLPRDEVVLAASSVAHDWTATAKCLLVLTDRRLVSFLRRRR